MHKQFKTQEITKDSSEEIEGLLLERKEREGGSWIDAVLMVLDQQATIAM